MRRGYLYCAICPFTGDLFCLLLPNMKKECFQVFIDEFENHRAGSGETLLILDGAGCHQGDTIKFSLHQYVKPDLNW
ncbi:hypothetical protein BH20ACI1_BH20ACI1_16860 [soil metagenome]